MNLTGKGPLGLKQPKKKKNKAHLDHVRGLPCAVCKAHGEVQQSPTTAHHPIHDRYGTHKVDDTRVVPLCDDHHQGLWGADPSKLAIHKDKAAWREKYGPDWSYVPYDEK